jgi:hypothetical protein
VRERLLRAHRFSSYEQANAAWREWNLEVARRRVHGAHGEIVAVRATRDRGGLMALPATPYVVVERTSRRVARDGMLSFEGRRYQVPRRAGLEDRRAGARRARDRGPSPQYRDPGVPA